MLPCIKYICHAILLRYFLPIRHALFNICYHRCSVFCLSTSVDLIPVCSIVWFSPRCSLPSFAVMPTGLLLALLLQNHSLLWRHCLHHLASNFVLSRCSSGIRAEFGTALRIDNPEKRMVLSGTRARNQNVAERGYPPGFAHLGIHVLFLPAYDEAMCSGLPWHHCLQPPHGVEGQYCFFFFLFSLALGCILATFSSIFPVFLAWHCAFHASAFRCHREIFATLEAGTCEVSRAWIYSFLRLPFSPAAPSHLGRIDLRCVVTMLPWALHAEHNRTQTAHEEFSLKGHCVTRRT